MEELDGFLIVVTNEQEWEDSLPFHDEVAGGALALLPVSSDIAECFTEQCMYEAFAEGDDLEEPLLFDRHDPRHCEVVNVGIAYALERRGRRDAELRADSIEHALWGLAGSHVIRVHIQKLDMEIARLEKGRDAHLAIANNLRKKARRMFGGVESLWLGKSLSVGNS